MITFVELETETNEQGILEVHIDFVPAPHSNFHHFSFLLSDKILKRTIEDEHSNFEGPPSVGYKFKKIGEKHFSQYGNVIWIDKSVNPFTLFVEGFDFSMGYDISPEATLEFKRILDEYIKSQARQRGRELTTMKNLRLPMNVIGHIGTFLTGNKGSHYSQLNQQKQKAGISLAPRASNRGQTMRHRK